MRTCRIGICSRDPEYASSLMLALNRISDGKAEAMVFSRPEVVSVCLPVQELDLLVLDGWAPDELGEETDGANLEGIPVRRLTDSPSDEGTFKYQSVREICKDLLSEARKRSRVSTRLSGCLAVFSPLGRCGKTTLARALARAEADRDGLYIGMEEYTDCPVHSEILYQIKRRTPDIYEAVVREQISDGGIRTLRVSGMYPELRDVQRGDLEWAHEQLLQPGRYRTLIYDIGGAALGDLSILELFDRIYMPVLPDDRSRAKVEHMREVLSEMRLGIVLRRLIPVELPQDAVAEGDYRRVLACVSGREE